MASILPLALGLILDLPQVNAQLENEFQQWTVGARVPCWYDPTEPATIVLKRNFGGANWCALLPLFPF